MSIVPAHKFYCRRCGNVLHAEHQRNGYDGFYGDTLYRGRRRCPNGHWRIFGGVFSRHDETLWDIGSAKYFGIEDDR